MSSTISIVIEGPGAKRALDEFFSIPGIVGDARPVVRERVTRDGGLLVAVGAIVGLVGGISSIVSHILEWREKWKKAHEDDRLSVVIEDAKGNRVSLEDATPEQVATALKTLQG
jgi:hypothetical protein